ncbi:MAG: HD domain-containing protein [Candidatus Helarchaeales archaeon]
MNSFDKALDFARKKHAGQVRKISEIEYVTHPIAVANILKDKSCNETLLIAALLHDTLEDTNTTYKEIKDLFGEKVADLVLELTSDREEKKKLGKAAYLSRKLNQMSSDALTIKLADRLHNVSDLNEADPKFRERYKKETMIILSELHRDLNPLQKELRDEILLKLESVG